MSGSTFKERHFLEDELSPEPDFSYINLVTEEPSKDPKRSHLNLYSNVRGPAKSREKVRPHKSKDPLSRSCSRKKSKTYERSQSKQKKTPKRPLSKIMPNTRK